MTDGKHVYLARILLLLLFATRAGAEPLAIRGGTIFPASANPIKDGILLIEKGKIQSVGSDVVIPSGARVIHAQDKCIVPGFIDALSSLYVAATELRRSAGGAPEWSVVDAVDPFIERHDEVLAQGVTAVYVTPPGSGVFAGRGAVLRLGAAKTTQLVLKADATVKARLGVSSMNQSSSLMRLDDYASIRETLIETQAYMQRQRRYEQELAEYEKNEAEEKKDKDDEEKDDKASRDKKPKDLKRPDKPTANPTHEILAKVLAKEIPLQVEAHRVCDIRNALRLAEEFEFSLVLDRCTEGYRIADEIARRKVPVLVGPVTASFVDIPQLDYRTHSAANAAILARAGIQTAIGVAGRDGLSSKFIALAGALAVADGMDTDAALRAITLTPAEILGVADRIGSLDVGKDADVVILTGPPFDTATQVEMVLVEGKTVYERNSRP